MGIRNEDVADANGERFTNGDSLVPPTFRARSSSAMMSASVMSRTESGNVRVSPVPGSSMEGGTFPDSVNAEVFDKPAELGVYTGVDEHVDVKVIARDKL